MKINKYNALTLSLFMLFPLYTLVGILRSMLAAEKIGYILFSIFMGVLAYLMIPYDTMDLTRHYQAFNNIKSLPFSQVISDGGFHLFLNIVMWTFNSLGFPKEAVVLSFVAIGYYLHLVLLLYILQDYQAKPDSFPTKYYIFIFVFIILNGIKFVASASGLRNELAFAVALFGAYLVFSRNENIKGLICLMLSAFIHTSAIILLPLVFIAKLKKLDGVFKVLFWLSLLIITTGVSSLVFFFLMDALKPQMIALGIYRPVYFSHDGAWGSGYFEWHNIKSLFLEKYIKPAPFYIVAVYLLVVKSTVTPEYRRFLYLLFFMIAIVSISQTLFDRYNNFAVLVFITMLMIDFRTQSITKLKKVFLMVFIVSLLAIDAANIYKYRDMYLPSWYKLLFIPMPILFLESVEPNEYIIRHGR